MFQNKINLTGGFKMKEYELKLNKVASIMESHISEARVFSIKDIKANDVLNSNVEDLLSDKMWMDLEKGRNPYYFDMVVFGKELYFYFIIIDELLYIKFNEMSFEIDGVMQENIYNMFRDIVLKSAKQ